MGACARPSSAWAARRWPSPAWCWRPSPWRFGLAWQAALFAGLALSLSSTAFALQVLEEKGELALRHGRLAFAVLLFQDLAAIPLIALTPLFAVVAARGAAPPMELIAALQGDRRHRGGGAGRAAICSTACIRLVARTRVKEAMTASALLTVVGVTLVMEQAGCSASLGAFLAGVLLADSDYRHEIEADIAPFEGLLLGLFFTAIGMSLNLGLVVEQPHLVLAVVAGLMAVKSAHPVPARAPGGAGSRAVATPCARHRPGRRVRLRAVHRRRAGRVLEQPIAELLSVAVTLSMAATPLLLLLDESFAPKAVVLRAFDALPENDGHVVIAGFGRVGQIVARILTRQAHPLHGARFRSRAGGLRAQVRRQDLLRRRQPARDPGGGADRQGARLRAGHRQRRGLAADGAAGAPELSARADLSPARATAGTRTS